MEEEQNKSTMAKFQNFVKECVRVVKVTKKPTGEEFKTVVKVSGLGILLLGFIGFTLTMFKQLIFK